MRVLICEDSVLLREGVARLLEFSGHQVVAALPGIEDLEATVDASKPDLCILDVRLPPTFTDEGVRAALRLRENHPDLALLVLSQYVEERYASELISGSTGSLGYLLKDRVADVDEFIASLEQVAGGATILDPEVVAQLIGRKQQDVKMQRLTPRERSVLALMAEGRSNQAIAEELFLSEASIEKHITSIFQKLELEQDDSGNRRVLATLAHLENTAGATQTNPAEAGPRKAWK
ncbi:response regulator transcription factor [Actinomycetaceae bacterium MB13-C1-2]|nr:response regulator transcription factor [Actinomycetaceae bacterium MB13-C1-2]